MKTSDSASYTLGDMVHFQSFVDKQALAESLAATIARQLNEAIKKRGHASLVVSGGSTPKPFFAALKQQNVPWDKLYVTLADERWVDGDHKDSNEKLVRENLLVDGIRFIGLKSDADTPHAGAETTEAALREIPQPFDAVVLGMGDDGHTASFFPNAPELQAALNPKKPDMLCAPITPPDYAPHPRITLTLPALLNAARIYLHITGQGKQDVYAKASGPGPVNDMPIRAVLRQDKTPVDVYWAA